MFWWWTIQIHMLKVRVSHQVDIHLHLSHECAWFLGKGGSMIPIIICVISFVYTVDGGA